MGNQRQHHNQGQSLYRHPGRSLLTAIALLSLSACTNGPWPWSSSPPVEDTPIVTTQAPPAPKPTPTPVIIPADVLERAATKAASATTLAKTAVTQDDWNLVILQWQRAIALLQPIPRDHPIWKTAQGPLTQYKKALNQAQLAAKNQTRAPVVTATATKGDPTIIGIVGGSSATTSNTIANVLDQLNQQQIAFWQQQQRFAKTLVELGNAATSNLPEYRVFLNPVGDNKVLLTAIAKQDGLLSYTGAVVAVSPEDSPTPSPTPTEKPEGAKTTRLLAIVCASAKPTKDAPGYPKVNNQQLQCPAGSVVAKPATSTPGPAPAATKP